MVVVVFFFFFLRRDKKWEKMKDRDCPYGAVDNVSKDDFRLHCKCGKLVQVHAKRGHNNIGRNDKPTTAWEWFKTCAASPDKKLLVRSGLAKANVDACDFWTPLDWLNEAYASEHGIRPC